MIDRQRNRIAPNRRSRVPGKARRKGATIVEFAMVVQVLLLLVFSCIEFSRLNMIRNLAQDAAYFAARNAMVPGATEDECVSEAKRILGFMKTKGASISVNDGDGLDSDSEEVVVRIKVPLDENALMMPFFTDNLHFEAQATMRTERYDGFYQPE